MAFYGATEQHRIGIHAIGYLDGTLLHSFACPGDGALFAGERAALQAKLVSYT